MGDNGRRMNRRRLSRSQIVFYALSVLIVLSMVISAFSSLFTSNPPGPLPTPTPAAAPAPG